MVELRVVIGNKDGKSYQKIIEEKNSFIGMKIGDNVGGDLIGMNGYEFLISGGSDDCGFPMRKGILGGGVKKILAKGGVGIRKKLKKGIFIRKTVAGSVIGDKTAQINLKVLKEGKKKLDEIFVKKDDGERKEPEEKKEKEVKEEPKGEKDAKK